MLQPAPSSALGTYALTGLGSVHRPAQLPWPFLRPRLTASSSSVRLCPSPTRIFAATRKSETETKVDKVKVFVKDAGKEEEDLSVAISCLPLFPPQAAPSPALSQSSASQ